MTLGSLMTSEKSAEEAGTLFVFLGGNREFHHVLFKVHTRLSLKVNVLFFLLSLSDGWWRHQQDGSRPM
jgi:hypothetical protein